MWWLIRAFDYGCGCEEDDVDELEGGTYLIECLCIEEKTDEGATEFEEKGIDTLDDVSCDIRLQDGGEAYDEVLMQEVGIVMYMAGGVGVIGAGRECECRVAVSNANAMSETGCGRTHSCSLIHMMNEVNFLCV
ncbi:unnamed protein product [Hydatigera taeniaeformis]|uniref:Uncharacterized protein n=1 Tax=Hydatigena taeniaeformis TaxID=6205 RepID=A0A0R3XCX0_HYDTA|nr:unnamed protein product [Hydatigera taeniaeformis]